MSDKPQDFLELSPTGKVPMIVEDDFVLYESMVINDYLAEAHDWESAYPSDLKLKYRQKVAMKQWDNEILGPFYSGLKNPEKLQKAKDSIQPELDYLADLAARLNGQTDSLFAFHFAPFWARMVWLKEHTVFVKWVRQRGELANWLDRTLEEEPIKSTLPDREWTLKQYEKNYLKAS